MGGRGSGGGKGGGGAASKEGRELTRDELVNLYNSISGNSAYPLDDRVKTLNQIYNKIQELDNNKKAKTDITKAKAIQKGSKIYNEKVKNNAYITRKEFDSVKEYLKNNGSKKEILKLANHYGKLYKNGYDKSGQAGAEFKSYELSLRRLAKQMKGD